MRETERHYMQTGNGNPLQDFQEITTESQDSIELKMSAKGERYWDLKVYYVPGQEALALERIERIDAQLRQKFGAQEEKP